MATTNTPMIGLPDLTIREIAPGQVRLIDRRDGHAWSEHNDQEEAQEHLDKLRLEFAQVDCLRARLYLWGLETARDMGVPAGWLFDQVKEAPNPLPQECAPPAEDGGPEVA